MKSHLDDLVRRFTARHSPRRTAPRPPIARRLGGGTQLVLIAVGAVVLALLFLF